MVFGQHLGEVEIRILSDDPQERMLRVAWQRQLMPRLPKRYARRGRSIHGALPGEVSFPVRLQRLLAKRGPLPAFRGQFGCRTWWRIIPIEVVLVCHR